MELSGLLVLHTPPPRWNFKDTVWFLFRLCTRSQDVAFGGVLISLQVISQDGTFGNTLIRYLFQIYFSPGTNWGLPNQFPKCILHTLGYIEKGVNLKFKILKSWQSLNLKREVT